MKLDIEKERLVIACKRQSLKKNLLCRIKASEHENIEFVQSFDELEKEIWNTPCISCNGLQSGSESAVKLKGSVK